jgi:hypothetical protein
VAGIASTATTALTCLSSPQDVFIDGNFYTYVADYGNSRIIRFPSGEHLFELKVIINYDGI